MLSLFSVSLDTTTLDTVGIDCNCNTSIPSDDLLEAVPLMATLPDVTLILVITTSLGTLLSSWLTNVSTESLLLDACVLNVLTSVFSSLA